MAVAAPVTGCDPVPQELTLTGGLSGFDTTTRALPPEGALSLSDPLDRVITNASYTGDLEKRAYLFSRPLWPGGVLSGPCSPTPFCYGTEVEMLTLPLPSASFETSSTNIAPDSTKWRGVRVYDIGLCSQHTPWADFGRQLADGIVGELKKKTGQVWNPRIEREGAANPILRGNATYERDRIGFSMIFHADEISDWACVYGSCTVVPIRAGCRDARVLLQFEIELGTTAAAYVAPAAGSGCAALAASAPIPNAHDPMASISRLNVAVMSDHCFVIPAETLAANLTTTFAAELPAGLAGALRDALLQPSLPFVRADLPARRCTCDSECTDGASPAPNPFGAGSGARHRCLDRHCGFQLEPDRFEVRPEGLEIVLAEDDSDPQAAVLMDTGRIVAAAGMCNGDREPRVPSDEAAVRGVLWGGGLPGLR